MDYFSGSRSSTILNQRLRRGRKAILQSNQRRIEHSIQAAHAVWQAEDFRELSNARAPQGQLRLLTCN